MERTIIESLIQDAITGLKPISQVVEVLLDEMGRGGRILVVDENLAGLDAELSRLNYTTYMVTLGTDDDLIKRELKGKVLVTNNGKDFVDDHEKFRYGLIWVTKQRDFQVLAREVDAALMKANFRAKVAQVVTIR
jgi:hypothetical protein